MFLTSRWVYATEGGAAFADWFAGQPDNTGGVEDCAAFATASNDHGYSDVDCSLTYNFLCEYVGGWRN